MKENVHSVVAWLEKNSHTQSAASLVFSCAYDEGVFERLESTRRKAHWNDLMCVPPELLPLLCISFPQLTDVDVSHTTIRDLTCLLSLTTLKNVSAEYTLLPLVTLGDTWRTVTLNHCHRFFALCIPEVNSLQEICLAGTALKSLAVLRKCANLMDISVVRCKKLKGLDDLASAPLLRTIDASESGIVQLGELHTCESLTKILLTKCAKLTTLSGLAGAPLLQAIDASESGLTELGELHQCKRLKTIDLTRCRMLMSLAGLAGAPALETANVEGSGLAELYELPQGKTFADTNLANCVGLQSVADLLGANSPPQIIGLPAPLATACKALLSESDRPCGA